MNLKKIKTWPPRSDPTCFKSVPPSPNWHFESPCLLRTQDDEKYQHFGRFRLEDQSHQLPCCHLFLCPAGSLPLRTNRVVISKALSLAAGIFGKLFNAMGDLKSKPALHRRMLRRLDPQESASVVNNPKNRTKHKYHSLIIQTYTLRVVGCTLLLPSFLSGYASCQSYRLVA
jgi:hypothetical protein